MPKNNSSPSFDIPQGNPNRRGSSPGARPRPLAGQRRKPPTARATITMPVTIHRLLKVAAIHEGCELSELCTDILKNNSRGANPPPFTPGETTRVTLTIPERLHRTLRIEAARADCRLSAMCVDILTPAAHELQAKHEIRLVRQQASE